MSDYTTSTYKAVEVVLVGLHDPFGHNFINFIPLGPQKNIQNKHYVANFL